MLFQLYLLALWPIASLVPMDNWGHPLGHPNCELDDAPNYVGTHLPASVRWKAEVMEGAKMLGLTYDEAMNMDAVEYQERLLINKAIVCKYPEYTPQGFIAHRGGIPLAQIRKNDLSAARHGGIRK